MYSVQYQGAEVALKLSHYSLSAEELKVGSYVSILGAHRDQTFDNEVQILSRCKHHNILQFIRRFVLKLYRCDSL